MTMQQLFLCTNENTADDLCNLLFILNWVIIMDNNKLHKQNAVLLLYKDDALWILTLKLYGKIFGMFNLSGN